MIAYVVLQWVVIVALVILGSTINRIATMKDDDRIEESPSFDIVSKTILVVLGQDEKGLRVNSATLSKRWDKLDFRLKMLLNILLKVPRFYIYKNINLSATEVEGVLTKIFDCASAMHIRHGIFSLTNYFISYAGKDSYDNLLELKNKPAFNGAFMKDAIYTFMEDIMLEGISNEKLNHDYKTSVKTTFALTCATGNKRALEMALVCLFVPVSPCKG